MYYQTILDKEDVHICVNAMLSEQSSVAVVIFPGLNLSKSGPFFLLSKVARDCASAGFNTFQFDYFGDGDSSGSYKDANIEYINLSISLVKDFAYKCGCTSFIYVGYGVGNIFVAERINDRDLIGICMIAPELYEYKNIEQVVEKTFLESAYIYNDKFLWPNTADEQLKKYWMSIIGVVDWLYYTPFKVELLKEISKININSFFLNDKIDTLILSPQTKIINKCSSNTTIVNIDSLHYRSYDEWYVCHEWPDVWTRIACEVKNWIKNLSFKENNKTTQKRKIIENQKSDRLVDFDGTTRIYLNFLSKGKVLSGVLHIPGNTSQKATRYPCVIYEPGLGGSRVDMNRAGLWLGDKLAQNGIACFRYDSIGSGVSEGEFYEMTWDCRYENLHDAISFLNERNYIDLSNIVIVSYSAGAKVACIAASRELDIKGYVLWSPYLIDKADGTQHTKLMLREPGLVQPMCGLWLGFDFVKQDKQFDFFKLFKGLTVPTLVITGTDYNRDINILPLIHEANEEKHIIQIPGAHCFLYKYMENVINETIKFVEDIIRGVK